MFLEKHAYRIEKHAYPSGKRRFFKRIPPNLLSRTKPLPTSIRSADRTRPTLTGLKAFVNNYSAKNHARPFTIYL